MKAIQSDLQYHCENEACHISPCCLTCWNTHPQNVPDDCFIHDHKDLLNKIVADAWVDNAMANGFTLSQALFLHTKITNSKYYSWIL